MCIMCLMCNVIAETLSLSIQPNRTAALTEQTHHHDHGAALADTNQPSPKTRTYPSHRHLGFMHAASPSYSRNAHGIGARAEHARFAAQLEWIQHYTSSLSH